jgi:hypothetical protein
MKFTTFGAGRLLRSFDPLACFLRRSSLSAFSYSCSNFSACRPALPITSENACYRK